MRVWAAVVLVAGCNQFFGIDRTDPRPVLDAQYFDAPIDAPFTCPPNGGTPAFSPQLNQIIQNCREYSTTMAGRATAMCSEPAVQISEGPADGRLEPIAGFEQDVTTTHIDLVRYAPEGNELFIRIWLQSTVVGRIVVARATGSGFAMDHDVALPGGETTDSFVRFGTPSLGPRRRMIIRNGSESGVREIEIDETGASTLVGTYTTSDFVVSTMGVPGNLSPDGLRYVFQGQLSGMLANILYTDRATLADRFSAARPLTGVPYSPTPFMTADCGRMYFDALNYMFWVQRL